MSNVSLAQFPSVGPRFVAGPGVADPADPNNVGEPVWETWLAAGVNKVISVFHQEVDASNINAMTIGYAVLNRSTGERLDTGVIPTAEDDTRGGFDPAIVWLDSGVDAFVACSVVARGFGIGQSLAIGVADYQSGAWSTWRAITEFQGGFSYDRPWLAAGDSYLLGRELYITYAGFAPTGHFYARSVNSGRAWTLGEILVDGEPLDSSPANYQPAASADGRLYIAHMPDTNTIQFVLGTDVDGQPGDPNYAGIEFEPIYLAEIGCGPQGDDPEPEPLLATVTLNRSIDDLDICVPGAPTTASVPWLAADPTNEDRLFVVYHDTATNDPNDKDMNIYCNVLTRSGGAYWAVSERVVVADPGTQYENDQLIPEVAVDNDGGVHVIFYDDREYNVNSDQADGASTPNPKFDVYYAYSSDSGESFTDEEIRKDPNDPNDTYDDETCLDYTRFLRDPEPDFDFSPKPGEYNGITVYGDEVWTCFTGTSQYELDQHPDNNPSVIWACLIGVP